MKQTGTCPLRVALVLLAGATTVWAARPELEFARYAIILEREPFGAPVAAPVAPPASSLVAPPDSFIKTLRMCAITESEGGLRVGLVDLKSAPPKSYFLYIGDVEDGVELVEADYAKERARLRKGSEEYWISMSADAQGGGGGGGGSAAATVSANEPSAKRLTYAERLRRRREADEAEQARLRELAARPVPTPEALDAQLKKFQMDVIRNGEPPLPIPLTPEMDDQLVAEGVLPPLE